MNGKDRKMLKGSMTVEMSFLMPIILFLIMSCILTVFYFHDKNVISAVAYETAVVGGTKAREKNGVTGGELQALFAERISKKCVLFPGSNVNVSIGEVKIVVTATAAKGRFGIHVVKTAAVTEPEKYIRDKRRIKEVIDGAANHD